MREGSRPAVYENKRPGWLLIKKAGEGELSWFMQGKASSSSSSGLRKSKEDARDGANPSRGSGMGGGGNYTRYTAVMIASFLRN